MGYSRASTAAPTRTTHPTVHRAARQYSHCPSASPDRTCAAAHRPWNDDYNVLPAIQHLLAATTPRPHAYGRTLGPQQPDHRMQPRAVSPAATADQHDQHQQKGSDRTATSPPLPPPRDIYATMASTLAKPMDAEQYYQHVLRELQATHATLQKRRQVKGGDNKLGPEDNFLWEDTWKGTKDTFLDAAATTYPRPPEDTQHSLHALLEASPHCHPPSPGPQFTTMDA